MPCNIARRISDKVELIAENPYGHYVNVTRLQGCKAEPVSH